MSKKTDAETISLEEQPYKTLPKDPMSTIGFTERHHQNKDYKAEYFPFYGGPKDLSKSYYLRALFNPLDPSTLKKLENQKFDISKLKCPDPFTFEEDIDYVLQKYIDDTCKLYEERKKNPELRKRSNSSNDIPKILIENSSLIELQRINIYELDEEGKIYEPKSVHKRYIFENHYNNIKVVIQITVFNESSYELYETIRSITDSYHSIFENLGYNKNNILIVVIFDGFAKLEEMYRDDSTSKNLEDLLGISINNQETKADKTDAININSRDAQADKRNGIIQLISHFLKKVDHYKHLEKPEEFKQFLQKFGNCEPNGPEKIGDIINNLEYNSVEKFIRQFIVAEEYKEDHGKIIKLNETINEYLDMRSLIELKDARCCKTDCLYLCNCKPLFDVDKKLKDYEDKKGYIHKRKSIFNPFKLKRDGKEIEKELLTVDHLNTIRNFNSDSRSHGLPEPDCHFFYHHNYLCEGQMTCNILYAIKNKNAGKLDSQNWVFQGICGQLVPDYLVLLDCGTFPKKDALYHFIKHLHLEKSLGGVCGQIEVDLQLRNEEGHNDYLNPILLSQHFEYKMSHYLDKPFESLIGFIPVLPGAFSAYKYEALSGKPLNQYFLLEDEVEKERAGPFNTNMYLAEDRILCIELLTKEDQNYTMKYIKDSIAVTDAQNDLSKLFKQRRRWLNGTLFAAIYSILNWQNVISKANHDLYRIPFLIFQYIYIVISQFVSLFSIANFFLSYYSMISLYCEEYGLVEAIPLVTTLFCLILVILIIYNIGNKIDHFRSLYTFVSFLLGVFSYVVIGLSIWTFAESFDSGISSDFMLAMQLFVVFGVVLIIGLLYTITECRGNPLKMIKDFMLYVVSLIVYYFYLPTYIVMLPLYAISNLHDVSWGTRDSSVQIDAKLKEKDDKFKFFRSQILLIYVVFNLIYATVIILYLDQQLFIQILFWIISVTSLFRFCFSLIYLIHYYVIQLIQCCQLRCMTTKISHDHLNHREYHSNIEELNGKIIKSMGVPLAIAKTRYQKEVLKFYHNFNIHHSRFHKKSLEDRKKIIVSFCRKHLNITSPHDSISTIEIFRTIFPVRYDDGQGYQCNEEILKFIKEHDNIYFIYKSLVLYYLTEVFKYTFSSNHLKSNQSSSLAPESPEKLFSVLCPSVRSCEVNNYCKNAKLEQSTLACQTPMIVNEIIALLLLNVNLTEENYINNYAVLYADSTSPNYNVFEAFFILYDSMNSLGLHYECTKTTKIFTDSLIYEIENPSNQFGEFLKKTQGKVVESHQQNDYLCKRSYIDDMNEDELFTQILDTEIQNKFPASIANNDVESDFLNNYYRKENDQLVNNPIDAQNYTSNQSRQITSQKTSIFPAQDIKSNNKNQSDTNTNGGNINDCPKEAMGGVSEGQKNDSKKVDNYYSSKEMSGGQYSNYSNKEEDGLYNNYDEIGKYGVDPRSGYGDDKEYYSQGK